MEVEDLCVFISVVVEREEESIETLWLLEGSIHFKLSSVQAVVCHVILTALKYFLLCHRAFKDCYRCAQGLWKEGRRTGCPRMLYCTVVMALH